MRASGYRAFRAPTLNELYRPFQVGTVLTAANERLRPETLWGSELGGQVVVERLSAQATGFWNRLSDPIANVTLAEPMDGATRQRQNLGRARIAGVDLDVAWRPAAPSTGIASVTLAIGSRSWFQNPVTWAATPSSTSWPPSSPPHNVSGLS